ncbi:MAG: ATP-binding protein [Anaerolineales bacterium]
MFFLGKHFDPQTQQLTDQRLEYDPTDLTTHAVCVGMTGSGKTGLCVTLLEEAALAGIPAILIDPKGDIANLLLQFPELRPEDFQPWVNVDEARRAKLSVEEYAAQTAQKWKDGLAQWALGATDIRRLRGAADFAVYTPGSDAGRQVSILKSLEKPELAWDDNQELLRERIAGICSGLLGLVGVEADPVKNREHILLANIFEHAWKNDLPLDLAELITQVQTPPFEKLGVFEVDRFYPEADRLKLAMSLNAIVAAPSFQSWITGDPLDIPALLHSPGDGMSPGKPRISILYVAHLNDAERMFFITLLLEQIVAWLRGQSGTTSLRGLLYFDEVFGYFPPYPFNPPSKTPLMRLLKQARAFGLGVMLVTQNPGDLDYKGLTNTGTWFIGKLQTERDKARLLEGLETINAQSRTTLNIADMDTLISSLAPRHFLLHNVHSDGPVVFHTRWAMSYLAGPLTREQIRVFKPQEVRDEGLGIKERIDKDDSQRPARRQVVIHNPQSLTPIPSAIPQYFLPASRSLEDAVALWRENTGNKRAQFGEAVTLAYRPALLAQAVVRYALAKAHLNTDKRFAFLVEDVPDDFPSHWLDFEAGTWAPTTLLRAAPPEAQLRGEAPAALTDPKKLNAWRKDLVSYLYRVADFTLHQNLALKLFSRPGQSYAEFVAQCQQAADRKLQDDVHAIRAKYDRQLDRLEDKLFALQRDLKDDREQLRAREAEGRWTGVENLVGLMLGRTPYRPMSTQTSRDRMANKTRADVEQGEETVERLQSQVEAVKREAQAAFESSKSKWAAAAHDIKELRVTPRRSDILVELFGLGWLPYWEIMVDGTPVEISARM